MQIEDMYIRNTLYVLYSYGFLKLKVRRIIKTCIKLKT